MKRIKYLFATLVFILLLTIAALAEDGTIHGDKTPPPPPLAFRGTIHGDAPSTGKEIKSDDTPANVAMEIALSLVKSILALF